MRARFFLVFSIVYFIQILAWSAEQTGVDFPQENRFFFDSVTEEKLSLGKAYFEIPKRQLQQASSQSLGEVLAQTPGFAMLSSGPQGQLQSLSFRGAKSEHMLVIVNGVVMNDLTSPAGAFDFSTLPASLVDRVLVYKRGQATKWGAGATAGAIEIFLKESTPKTEINLGYSSFDDKHVSVAKQGLAVDLQKSGGYSSADEALGNRESDDSHQMALIFVPKVGAWKPTFFHQQRTVQYDSYAGAGGDDPNAWTSNRQSVFSLQAPVVSSWQSILSYRELERNENNEVDGLQPSSLQAIYKLQKTDLELKYAFSDLGLGLQVSQERTRSASIDPYQVDSFDSAELNKALWGQYRFLIGEGLNLELGLRHDELGVGAAQSGRLAIEFNQADYTSGFEVDVTHKAPTSFQRMSSYGNPQLSSENSIGLSFVVAQEQPNGGWEVELFDRQFSELIDFDVVSSKYKNLSRVQTSGVAAFAQLQIGQSQFKASATSLNAKDKEAGDWLLRRPFLRSQIEVERPLSAGFSGGLRADYHGDRDDLVSSRRQRVEGQVSMDSFLRWGLDQSIVFFEVKNVFRQRRPVVWGYTEPDVHFNLNVNTQF